MTLFAHNPCDDCVHLVFVPAVRNPVDAAHPAVSSCRYETVEEITVEIDGVQHKYYQCDHYRVKEAE